MNEYTLNEPNLNGGRTVASASGSLVRIEQDVGLRQSGSGAIITIEQNVKTKASGVVITIQQVVENP